VTDVIPVKTGIQGFLLGSRSPPTTCGDKLRGNDDTLVTNHSLLVKGEIMKKLLAALVAAVFSLTAAAPAIAAERDKKPVEKAKKDDKKKDKKKDEKKAGQAPGKAAWDQNKNKKQ